MSDPRETRWPEQVLPWVLGAPRERLVLLRAALDRDRAVRRELAAGDYSLPPQAITTLIGMYLALVGLELAAITFSMRTSPGAALHVLVLVQVLLVVGLGVSTLSQVLLGDEGFRVIASWPVRSSTYVAARLHRPTAQSIAACALICAPSALMLAVIGPLPVVTGLVYAVLVPVLAVATLWLIAVGLIAGLGWLGARRTRNLASLLQIVGLLSPVALAVIGASPERLTQLVTAAPAWLPTRWLASLPLAASGALPKADLWMLPVAILCLALPARLLRAVAHRYTAGLGSARQAAPTRVVPAMLSVLSKLARRREDRVLATLCVAHTRTDWRFRARFLVVPALTAGGVAGMALGLPLERGFADPFVTAGALHPGMVTLALGLVLPILSVPVLMRSADSGAAWVLQTGTLPARELRTAMLRLARLVYVLPYLVALVVLYGLAGVSPLGIAAHVGFVGLGAEVATCAVLATIPHLPFSRPADDEELATQTMVAAVLLYVMSVIIAVFVFHVVYRWPMMYAATVLFLLLSRRLLLGRVAGRPAKQLASAVLCAAALMLASGCT